MKKILLGVLLAVLSLTARAQQNDSQLVDAVALIGQGEYGRAAAVLEILSQAAPQNDAYWYYLGLAEAGRGKLDAAVNHFSRAVQLDPHNYWYKDRLAGVYLAKGEEDMVIQLYESILAEFPDKVEVSYDLLGLYLKQGQMDKALSALQEIENRIGPTEQVIRTRYDIFRQQGRDEEAIALLEDYNEEFTSPVILSMMGDFYLAEYKDSLALSCYQEALRTESDYVPALLGETEVFRTTRRYPEYFSSLDRFIGNGNVPVRAKSLYVENLLRSIDPKLISLHRDEYDKVVTGLALQHPADTAILTTAGAYFYSTARPEKALPYFRSAAVQYPESLSQTVTYIQFLSLNEQWEEMRDRSVEAFNRFRELGFIDYANMANIQLKDYDAVIGNSRYVISVSPDDKDIQKSAWATIGDVYHMKGDTKSAYKAYDKALRLDPDYVPVLNNYAYYLSLEGRKLKKAYTMSKKTVEAEPDNATYLDTFAWILHLQGKDIEAKPLFKHAMLYGGKESPVILDHYAEVLFSLKEYDLARVYWNQAVAKNKDNQVPDLQERMEARLKSVAR